MCIVERFVFVHPNGITEQRDHIVHCERGRPNAPCDIVRVVNLEDQYPPGPGPAFAPPQQVPLRETRSPRRDLRREDTRKPGTFFSGLRLGLKIGNPFTTRRRHTSKSKHPKLEFVREKPRHTERVLPRQPPPQQRPPPQRPSPQRPPPQRPPPERPPQGGDWYTGPQGPQEHQEGPRIIEVPIFPPGPQMRDMNPPPREREVPRSRRSSRRRTPPAMPIHFQDTDEPSQYISPNRQHRRRARTQSPNRSDEEHKRYIEEKERRQAAERNAQNAIRIARDLQRQAQNAEMGRADAQRDVENVRDLARELYRERHIESERRRKLQEDKEHLARQLRERALRDQEDRERLARAQMAGIPRQPRHPHVLHHSGRVSLEERHPHVLHHSGRVSLEERHPHVLHHSGRVSLEERHPHVLHHDGRGSLEERGDQVLREDVLAESYRRAGRAEPRGWFRRREVGGDVRRRDRAAIGERVVHEDDRRRAGRRW